MSLSRYHRAMNAHPLRINGTGRNADPFSRETRIIGDPAIHTPCRGDSSPRDAGPTRNMRLQRACRRAVEPVTVARLPAESNWVLLLSVRAIALLAIVVIIVALVAGT